MTDITVGRMPRSRTARYSCQTKSSLPFTQLQKNSFNMFQLNIGCFTGRLSRNRGNNFVFLLDSEKQLKHDNYLVPYALMELALIFIHSGSLDEAKNILDKAK